MQNNYQNDNRIVLTLDAGGTNFSFSAFSKGREIVEPLNLSAEVKDLDKALTLIKDGFNQIKENVKDEIYALSFSFPGPADYKNGIIDNVGNLPAFAGGVALGPYLEEQFGVPVHINNDGDLFAYGEGRFGALAWLNNKLVKANKVKRFNNLIGITLGTGIGGGLYSNGQLFAGDNSNGMEIWTTRCGIHNQVYLEEKVSKRAIVNSYGDTNLSPRDIYHIALGEREGNEEKAKKAFSSFGASLGEALANVITLLDGIVVIGGGLAKANKLFMPSLLKTVNGKISNLNGEDKNRIEQKLYNLNEQKSLDKFIEGNEKTIRIPGSDRTIQYDSERRVGLMTTQLGTNKATSLGAYAYALDYSSTSRL